MAGGSPPPVLQLPWGTTIDGKPVSLTASALEFLQLLWSQGGSGGAVAWSAISGKPANVTALAALTGAADTVPYFTGFGTMAITALTAFGRSLIGAASAGAVLAMISPLTTKGDIFTFGAANTRLPVGTDGQVLTAASGQPTGLQWAAGGGGGGSGPYRPLTFYGAVENGVADDKAAIDAWLADTTHTVWLEGVSLTSDANARVMSKRARGTGNFHFSITGDWIPAQFVWMTVKPQVGTGVGNNYNFSGDISRTDARYTILGRLTAGGNIRRSLTEVYYEPVVTPQWDTLTNLSGWSGITCRLAAGIVAGATAAQVNATGGITTGDLIGFYGPSGNIAEQRAVTVVDATHLSWSGGLSNNYAANTGLTQGLRTMDPIRYMEVNHFGGGDSYAIVAVVTNAYAKTAGQQHWVETSTVGLFGGSLAFGAAGVYGTGLEMQYADNGFDVNLIADVESFTRTNQAGALGCFWGRDWTQSTGFDHISGAICPMDAVYTMGGWARVGFDAGRMTFTGQTADPAVAPVIQSGLGHRWYMNASVTPGGRGTDPRGIYAAMYANTPGDMYIGSANDGVSDVIDLKFDRPGGSRIRMRPDSVNINNPLNLGSQLHLAGNLILPSGGYFHNIGAAVYWFNGTTDTLVAP